MFGVYTQFYLLLSCTFEYKLCFYSFYRKLFPWRRWLYILTSCHSFAHRDGLINIENSSVVLQKQYYLMDSLTPLCLYGRIFFFELCLDAAKGIFSWYTSIRNTFVDMLRILIFFLFEVALCRYFKWFCFERNVGEINYKNSRIAAFCC